MNGCVKAVALVLVLACVTALGSDVAPGGDAGMKAPSAGPVITIVYDNRPGAPGLEPGWGFACVVEGLERTVLFDTGGDGDVLLGNMATLGFRPEDIDVVVLSHGHDDHTGGLRAFLESSGEVTLYLLKSFPRGVRETATGTGARLVEVMEPVEICTGAVSSGELLGDSDIPEQCLIVDCGPGSVVITGCAHPGIVNMVGRARAAGGKDVLAVLGGFHLLRDTRESVLSVIRRLKELGVRYAMPCHCSGDDAIELFAREYGAEFVKCSVGSVISAEGLIGGVADAAE